MKLNKKAWKLLYEANHISLREIRDMFEYLSEQILR